MNILFLTHRLPYAPNRGDRVRAYHLLRELGRFAEVDVISLVHDVDEGSRARDLDGLAASVTAIRVPRVRNAIRAVAALPTRKPTTHSLLAAPGLTHAVEAVAARRRLEIVLSYCTGVAPLAFLPALRDVPLVLDMVDVDSAKWAAYARSSPPPLSWVYAREARLLSRFEREAASHARLTLVVTGKEKDTLAAIAPGARIEVVANGVDAASFARPAAAPASGRTVVFCGVMNYAPNVEGAVWLARHVWPLVQRVAPDARLEIVGSDPTRAVRGLGQTAAGITVTGHVADVRPHLWSAAVAVAPLLTARGVQNKVLEAVAASLPVVVTPVVSEGLPSEVQPACVTAADADRFAAAIVTLLEAAPDERRRLASRADVAALSWERRLAGLRELLTEAARAVC